MATYMNSILSLTLYLVFSLLSYGQLILPEATGQYAVGLNTAKLVDESRTDPFDPDAGKRNVMVSLFYPVERTSCHETCPVDYMPPATAKFFSELALTRFGVPKGTLEGAKLQVCCKMSSCATEDLSRFPVVLFSPGLSFSRFASNAMAQSLASAGFVVAAMDHTFEGAFVEFPDGSVVVGLNETDFLPILETTALTARIGDGTFVLDQLSSLDGVQKFMPGAAKALKTDKAGFFGHSFGGATAITSLTKDSRYGGGLNLDGSQYGLEADVQQPALFFGRAEPYYHNSTNDESWAAALNHFKGWGREIAIIDSGHISFCDLPLLFKLAGLPVSDDAKELLGTLDGARSFKVMTDYVEAFMDFTLKGKTTDLFDTPSSAYPEIRLS